MKTEIKNESGTCPKCGKYDLDYGLTEYIDEGLGYIYVCRDCGFEGIEWYVLQFDTHTNADNVDIRIED